MKQYYVCYQIFEDNLLKIFKTNYCTQEQLDNLMDQIFVKCTLKVHNLEIRRVS